jgi:hypothetical protein
LIYVNDIGQWTAKVRLLEAMSHLPDLHEEIEMQIMTRSRGMLAIAAGAALFLSACAQSSQIDSLRTEVNSATQMARDANAKADAVQKSADAAASAAQLAAKRAEDAAEAARRAAEQADRAYRGTLKK